MKSPNSMVVFEKRQTESAPRKEQPAGFSRILIANILPGEQQLIERTARVAYF